MLYRFFEVLVILVLLRTISYTQGIKEQVDREISVALGGMLKYELASLHGFNAGVAFITSQDIGFLSTNYG